MANEAKTEGEYHDGQSWHGLRSSLRFDLEEWLGSKDEVDRYLSFELSGDKLHRGLSSVETPIHRRLVSKERAQQAAFNLDRAEAVNLEIIPALAASSRVSSRRAYFRLHEALIGADINDGSSYIPAEDPESLEFESHRVFTRYRQVGISDVYNNDINSENTFHHPDITREIRKVLDKTFLIIDEVIEQARRGEVDPDSEEFDVFACNAEFLISLGHGVFNGSGRTTEALLDFIFARAGSKNPPHISQVGWRNNDGVKDRIIALKCSRLLFNQELSRHFGVEMAELKLNLAKFLADELGCSSYEGLLVLQEGYKDILPDFVNIFAVESFEPLFSGITLLVEHLRELRGREFIRLGINNAYLDTLAAINIDSAPVSKRQIMSLQKKALECLIRGDFDRCLTSAAAQYLLRFLTSEVSENSSGADTKTAKSKEAKSRTELQVLADEFAARHGIVADA